MECYEGATMIKTYRGMLADGGQDRIRLKTNKGDIGYRIKKFELMPAAPGTVEHELMCKIYKLKQSTIDGLVDFTDGDLLAVSIMTSYAPTAYITATTTVFDNEIFNQDIYVTAVDTESNSATNYYLELEQIKLNENESTMATLQSLRRFGLPRN